MKNLIFACSILQYLRLSVSFFCVLFALDFERSCVEIVVLIFKKIGQKVVEPVRQCACAI